MDDRQALTAEAACAVDTRTRTLLLVDDEENIRAALKRLLRRDGYTILSAGGGQEGLDMLAQNAVDVIVSDQRMPHMTGVEFLRRAKIVQPETVRIVLSGYTELQSITDAINEGAIYKFLTKPWDDEQFRANIAEAFHYKGLADDNRRLGLALQAANIELAGANEKLRHLLAEKQHQLVLDEASLDIAREVLHSVPAAIVGIDDEGMAVFSNAEADTLLGGGVALLASYVAERLPAPLVALISSAGCVSLEMESGGRHFLAQCREMGEHSRSHGRLLIVMPLGGGR